MNIVQKEGYSSSMDFTGEERIWLGERNFLMAGEAAGLIDLTRSVGMDAAALSGRLAAKAIGMAEKSGQPVSGIYAKLMKSLVAQTRKNQSEGVSPSPPMPTYRRTSIRTSAEWAGNSFSNACSTDSAAPKTRS